MVNLRRMNLLVDFKIETVQVTGTLSNNISLNLSNVSDKSANNVAIVVVVALVIIGFALYVKKK